MSSTDHIATERALFVLALEPDDSEYREAWAHAAQCERCQQLLQEHRALLTLLDEGLTASVQSELSLTLTSDFEARVVAAVTARARMPRWASWLLTLGALLSGVLAAAAATQAHEHEMHLGVFCLLFEQGFAISAFALGAVFAKRYVSLESPWQAALLSMSGALLGQAVLMLRCGATGAVQHLLLFHVLGVAVATGVGALAGPRVTRLLRAVS